MVFNTIFLAPRRDIPTSQPFQIHNKLKMRQLNNRKPLQKAIIKYIFHNKIKVLLNNLQELLIKPRDILRPTPKFKPIYCEIRNLKSNKNKAVIVAYCYPYGFLRQ